jgi:hypothetical protein
MTKKNAPDLPDPSSPGGGSVCVGDAVVDTDCSLEAPRKARSEAQIAAFEKARAKRAANRAASAPAAPAAKTRKARTDKKKKRGYFKRPEAAAKTYEEGWYPPPRSGYDHFVIV